MGAQDDSSSPPSNGMSSNAFRDSNATFKRCTWNWNFNGEALAGSAAAADGIASRDPETWFNGAEDQHGGTDSKGKGPFGEFRPWGNSASRTTNSAIGTNIKKIERHEDFLNGFGHLIFPVVHEIKFHLNFRFETSASDGTTDANNDNLIDAPADATKYAHMDTTNGEVLVGNVLNSGITNGKGGHHFSFTLKCLVSSLDGTGNPIADQTVTQTKTHITEGDMDVHVKDVA